MTLAAASPQPSTSQTVGPIMASSYMAGVQNQRMVSLDDDSWFFSQSWQAGEAEATADIAHGARRLF